MPQIRRLPLLWSLVISVASLTAIIIVIIISASGASASAPAALPLAIKGSSIAATPSATPGLLKIAYSGTSGNSGYNIWTMTSDGANRTDLTNYAVGNEYVPSWSPDGNRIAFNRQQTVGGHSSQIFIMNSDGSGAHNITNDAYQDIQPSWSPDGTKIAYATDLGLNSTLYIYVMNADGSHKTALAADTGNYNSRPSWSPDGTKIAYSYQATAAGNPQLYVMDADGSHKTPLVTTGPATWPSWSPDGTKIAYQYTPNYSQPFQIYVVAANGTNPHRISIDASQYDDHPAWGRDGILFVRLTQIWLMNADGSNPHMISPGGSTTSDQPAWGPGPGPVVQVLNENQTPVPDAEVYQNDNLLGRTNGNGVITLPNQAQGDTLIARSLVYTGTTQKASHDNWAYHVWLTNIDQETDGSQTPYTITDTDKMTQTVTLKHDDAQIGINLVGSFNYNATSEAMDSVSNGLESASAYLFDVTDGQMYFEDLSLFDDNDSFQDADLQFVPSVWPSADPKGPAGLAGSKAHMYMPGPGFNGQSYRGGWEQPSAYRTFVHEFGHYGFGALDEYYRYESGVKQDSKCPTDGSIYNEDSRASIMYFQYNTTEICDDADHNSDTSQGQTLNESVWATFVRNWSDSQNRWTLRSPMTRGYIDPGPFTLPAMDHLNSIIAEPASPSCAAIDASATLQHANETYTASDATVTLTHDGRAIDEGPTDKSGDVTVYGANVGDKITVTINTFGTTYTATYTVTDCDTAPTLDLTNASDSPSAAKAPQPPTAPFAPSVSTAFNHSWLTSTLNLAQNRLELALHFDGSVPAAPTLSVSQDGGSATPVTLTYNASTFTYSGSFTVNPAYALNFSATAQIPSSSQPYSASYRIIGAQYSSGGPYIAQAVQQTPLNRTAPSGWSLFPAESMAAISVDATSLANNTGVVVGQTNMPADAPSGKLAVGGPYYVQGDHPILADTGLSLNFQADYFCGLQSNSVSIYRYDGTGWTALDTSIDTTWNQADTSLTQWGIYAVFATPNPSSTFSDVPPSNTFYTYINWMTCHSIASGYSDGTFRPSNNSTRGQVTKMVVLAFNWDQEVPTTSTFTDVPVGSTFFSYVEAAYKMGVFSGYPCGGPGEPCDSQHRPYFRPSSNVTRGQIAKILSNSALFNDTPTAQLFTDVPPTNTFYVYIERMGSRGIIGGYPCGGPGEPCDSQHRPYFRPANSATRGQLSKMIFLTDAPR